MNIKNFNFKSNSVLTCNIIYVFPIPSMQKGKKKINKQKKNNFSFSIFL